jgi:hypothetical protein
MMDFSKWAFKNRNLVYFCIAVLVVGGTEPVCIRANPPTSNP